MTVDPLSRRVPSSVSLRGITYGEEEAGQWRFWLSDEEQACIASFGSEKRRREFLAGRAAARSLLGDCLDVSPEQVPLRRAADDAVDVVGTDWRVSISHSGPHALAGCARHRVGVDLERIQSRDPAIARFLFAPEDRGLVADLPYDSDAALVLCWTLKEAVLKARRTGFRTSPKDLHLQVRPKLKTASVEVQDGGSWQLFFSQLEDYWGAVAYPDTSDFEGQPE